MNGRPFYELEGGGEDVYLYYYHDGKKNRYWLISKYVRIDKKIRNLTRIFKYFRAHCGVQIALFARLPLLTVYFYLD